MASPIPGIDRPPSLTTAVVLSSLQAMASHDLTRGALRRPAFAAFVLALVLLLLAAPIAARAQDQSSVSASGSFTVGPGSQSDGGSAGDRGMTLDPALPTGDQYLDNFTRITSNTPSTNVSGGLPFTGFDVGVIATVGVVLVGLGVAVRRIGAAGGDA